MPLADPYSPEWWRDCLLVALDKQTKRVVRLEKYYDHGYDCLPEPPGRMNAEAFDEARRAFENLSKVGISNWSRMIARAVMERIKLRGFRFGDPALAINKKRADEAWRLYEANHLGTDFPLALETIFSTGSAYGLVWPSDVGAPSMTLEHPSEVIIGYAAGSRRLRSAALKRWIAEDGRVMVTLYMPAWVYKWQSPASSTVLNQLELPASVQLGLASWEQRQPKDETWPLANPLGVVPVVEFAVNTGLRARPFGGGKAEFEGVLSIQDRINKNIFDRLVTAEHQAFRQRWSIGWEPPTDPKTREPDPRAVQRASQSSLWTFWGAGAEHMQVGEFGQADFSGFIDADNADVNAMAAITETPPHYLLGAMVNISGDGITAAESGMASKATSHAEILSDPAEEFIRLGLLADGKSSAKDLSSTVVWGDFERRSWAQKIDGILKLLAIGVPIEELWAMVPDVTPQDVARWVALGPNPLLGASVASAAASAVQPNQALPA